MEKRKIEITIILMTFFLSLSIIFSFIAQSKLQNINLQSNSINMKLNQQIISTLKEEEVNQTRLNMQVGEYLDNWKDYEKECNLFN